MYQDYHNQWTGNPIKIPLLIGYLWCVIELLVYWGPLNELLGTIIGAIIILYYSYYYNNGIFMYLLDLLGLLRGLFITILVRIKEYLFQYIVIVY